MAVLDLGAFGYQFVYRGGWPVTLEEYTASIPRPPDSDGRVVSSVANQGALAGFDTVAGYMPLVPAAPLLEHVDEFGERSVPHLRVAGVRWVQQGPGGSLWTQLSWSVDRLQAQSREWTEVPNPLPRARCVTAVTTVGDPIAHTALVDVERVATVAKGSGVQLDG